MRFLVKNRRLWTAAIVLACPLFGQQPVTLSDAAMRADAAAARKLLDAGADPNQRDEYGLTPLMQAASLTARHSGDFVAVAKLLLDRGADPNARSAQGRTAFLDATLGYASESGILPVSQPLVELLLNAGSDINAQSVDGTAALHQVAGQWASQPRIVEFLLDRGGRLDARNHDGRTPLMVAAMHGRTIIVTLLRRRGADPALQDLHGMTALDLAVEAGFPDTVAVLQAGLPRARAAEMLRKSRDRGLLRAIRSTDYQAAHDLLEHGASPNAGAGEGEPALVQAAANSSGESLVRLLVEKGAVVNAADRDGLTPLMAAAGHYGHEECALLLAHGAAVEARDAHGNTALLRAAAQADGSMEARWGLVRLLLDKGADPKAANDSGVTALMRAAERASVPALQALLDRGAEVHARDRDGRIALLIAVRRGDPEPVELLLDRHAEVNARDRSGRSVLLAAIDAPEHFSYQDQERFSPQIVRMLLRRGADPNLADDQGDTPLEAARRRGYAEAVAMLHAAGAR